MTVYVDDVQHRYGRMIMCHMWADSEEELIRMVDHIGVPRKWIQKPPQASWTHFDISLAKKEMALEAGAVLTDKYGPVEHVCRLRLKNPNLSEEAKDTYRKRLEAISHIRNFDRHQPELQVNSTGESDHD